MCAELCAQHCLGGLCRCCSRCLSGSVACCKVGTDKTTHVKNQEPRCVSPSARDLLSPCQRSPHSTLVLLAKCPTWYALPGHARSWTLLKKNLMPPMQPAAEPAASLSGERVINMYHDRYYCNSPSLLDLGTLLSILISHFSSFARRPFLMK
jgi:hypothetical protein